MTYSLNGELITVGGDSISVENITPTDDFQTLQITGTVPTGESATAELSVVETTGDGNLSLLFSGTHTITKDSQTSHLIRVDDGDRAAFYDKPQRTA